jgi:hypothetical protein
LTAPEVPADKQVDPDPGPTTPGETFPLTAGVDAGNDFLGGAGNDTYTANPALNSTSGEYDIETLNGLDALDGGDGEDSLTVAAIGAYTVPSTVTIENIETVSFSSDSSITADSTDWTGITNLNVTKGQVATLNADSETAVEVSGIVKGVLVSDDGDASDDTPSSVTIEGGSTQTVDVNKAGIEISLTKAAGAIDITSAANETLAPTNGDVNADITTTHGTDVTVNATLANATTSAKTAGDITVGDGADNQSGAVDITQNLTSDGQAALTGGDVTVNGGTTVDVTVNATSTAKDGSANSNIQVGAVNVTADDATTEVSVTQNRDVTTTSTAAEGGNTETASVEFGALKEGDTLEIDGLVFEASQDLEGADVAAAFASLINGDYQSAGVIENGFYTGQFGTSWTSVAAEGSTVVFTSDTSNTNVTDLDTLITLTNTTTNSVAPTVSTTQGAAVTAPATGPSTNTVNYGAVDVREGGNNSVTTVTVDGYSNADLGVAGADLDALTTLTLANSDGTADVATASTALDFTVDDVDNAVDLDKTGATITNLDITATGGDSAFGLIADAVTDLTINATADLDIGTGSLITALENVDINGTGAVDIGDVTVNTIDSFDASDNSGGVTATVEVDDATITGDVTEYIFSEGSDSATLHATTGTANDVDITLGAGDDLVDLSMTGIDSTTGTIDGGADTDTIKMDAAAAVTATGGTAFENKIEGFEKLSVGQTASGDSDSIDLANMDDISYVISKNAVAGSTTDEVQTLTIVPDGASDNDETLTVTYGTDNGGTTATVAVDLSAIDVTDATAVATEVATKLNADSTFGPLATASASGADVILNYDGTGADTNINTNASTAVTAGTESNLDSSTGATTTDGNGSDTDEVQTLTIVPDGASDNDETLTVTYGTDNGGTTATVAVDLSAIDVTDATAVAAEVATKLNADSTFGPLATASASGADVTIDYDDSDGTTGVQIDTVVSAALTAGTLSSLGESAAAETTAGGAAAVAAGAQTFTNMADGGTLELTDAGAGVVVEMTEATGDADTFNIITEVTTLDLDFGTIDVAGVETLNVTANDNDGFTTEEATIDIKADKAAAIDVNGDSDVTLTLDATSTKVATVDASDLTGDLTFTAGVATVGTTVEGGSGNDVLTADGENDVLNGGEGADTFNAYDLTTVDGGGDADIFNFFASSNMSKVSTVDDGGLTSGDVFNLFIDDNDGGLDADSGSNGDDIFDGGTNDILVNKFYSDGAQYNENTTTTIGGKVDASVQQTAAGEATWFNHDGNTYIVVDTEDPLSGDDVYEEGQDTVIEILGSYDLANDASFNASQGTLEIA